MARAGTETLRALGVLLYSQIVGFPPTPYIQFSLSLEITEVLAMTCCVALDQSLLFMQPQVLTCKRKGSGSGQKLELFFTFVFLPTLTPVARLANKG